MTGRSGGKGQRFVFNSDESMVRRTDQKGKEMDYVNKSDRRVRPARR